MNNANDQNLPSCVIEDEPPHEFYANLTGTAAKSYSRRATQSLIKEGSVESIKAAAATSTGATVIPVEDHSYRHEASQQSIYRKFLSQPKEQSKLSLDVSNKGFRMLARMGWKESEGGLGRSRQGMLEPVKAKSVQSLGFKESSDDDGAEGARRNIDNGDKSTTHAPGGKSVGMQETKVQRRQRIKQEAEKERLRNKRARLLIYSDNPEEYHAYL